VITLFPASKDDCAEIGIALRERRQYVRLDDGKASYGKESDVRWLRWQSMTLANGDEVGALVPHDTSESIKMTTDFIGGLIVPELMRLNSATMPVGEAVSILLRDPIFQKEGRLVLISKIERLFSTPVPTSGVTLTFVKDTKGSFLTIAR
jgi:hypothetical protein